MKKIFLAVIILLIVLFIYYLITVHKYRSKLDQQQLAVEKQMTIVKKAKQDGELADDFFAQNKDNVGVVTLPSGLQYKILDKGNGAKPQADSMVTVDYEGKLLNGGVFDSSYKRGKPASFRVNQVIKGWQEALQLMPVGSTWELYIPASLAYGEHGAPPIIGPNEALIFKVHLIAAN